MSPPVIVRVKLVSRLALIRRFDREGALGPPEEI
jgi:hypothetical protein